jgi:hypothetical protein
MKLESLKLANSIKVGENEGSFFRSAKFDLELENSIIIRVTDKYSKAQACTSLFNCIYYVEEKKEKLESPEVGQSPKSTPKRS